MEEKITITANSITEAMGLVETKNTIITYGKGDRAVKIPVKTRLSISERAMMVNDIVSMVFIADSDGTKYYPAFKKFAIEYNIVNYFTEVLLPTDSNEANAFLEQSALASRIIRALPEEYINNIIDEADEAIEYRKQELLKKNKFDDILDSLLNIFKELNKETNGIELPQIMEYIEKNMPEFKGQLSQLISTQITEAPTTD